jgi:ribonuclease P protein component
MERLKRRREFLRAARGRKSAARGLVLQAVDRSDDAPPRVGFTVTKKVGKAAQRNRARRRLREAVRAVMPDRARAGYDYVVIGRRETLTRPFEALKQDLEAALGAVHGKGSSAKRRDRRETRS